MINLKRRDTWIAILGGFVLGFVAGGSVATYSGAGQSEAVVERPADVDDN